jgi:transcriptional regulator with XRE-family HTH domain
MAEEEAARLVRLLSALVRLSKRSMRSLEAELGLRSSVVSKFLSGAIRPQISYVLMIASALGLTPEEFFARAYRLRKSVTNPLVQELTGAEREAGVEDPVVLVNLEQLDRLADASVRRALRRLGAEPDEPTR